MDWIRWNVEVTELPNAGSNAESTIQILINLKLQIGNSGFDSSAIEFKFIKFDP